MGFTFEGYQDLARRTQNAKLTPPQKEAHALHGLVSEVGEIHSLYQHYYQGENIDEEKLRKEMGDVLWFLAELADTMDASMADIAMENIEKLRRRYPQGFDTERSEHRHENEV